MKLSLCPKCYCMTKVIRGKCGKCNFMKTWRKEFIDKFANLRVPAFSNDNFVGYLDKFGRITPFKEKEILDFIEKVEEEAFKRCLKAVGEDEKINIPKKDDGIEFLEAEMPKRVRNMFRAELRKDVKKFNEKRFTKVAKEVAEILKEEKVV